MAVTLGNDPEMATIILSTGADLVFSLDPKTIKGAPAAWPAGTTSRLQILNDTPDNGGTEVFARGLVVSPNAIDCLIQSDDTDPLVDVAVWFRIYVSLPETPTQDYLIYRGRTERKD